MVPEAWNMMKFAKPSRCNMNRLSFRSKILFVCVFLVIIPSFVIGLFNYYRISAVLEGRASSGYQDVLRQTQTNIRYRLREVENLSKYLTINNMTNSFLEDAKQGYADIGQMIDDYASMKEVFMLVQMSNPEIIRVRLFAYGSPMYSRERFWFYPIEEAYELSIYQNMRENKKTSEWTNAYEHEYLYRDRYTIVSFACIIHSLKIPHGEIGFLMMDLNIDTLQSVLNTVDVSDESLLLLHSSDQLLAAKHGANIKSQVRYEALEKLNVFMDNQEKTVTLNGSEYMVIRQDIPPYQWTLHYLVPIKQITAASGEQLRLTLLQMAGFSLFAIFLGALLSNTLTRGIRTLVKAMERMSQTGEMMQVEIHGSDEISLLGRMYNVMIQRVNDLMGTIYHMEIKKREMEIKVLEGQINPHFLYNTLDTIKWIALENGAQTAANMSEALSRFFRISLNRGRDILTVAEEVRHVQTYLEIQNTRMNGRINWINHMDSSMLSERILKLLLQPVIENAVLHGVQENPGRTGTVILTGVRQENDLVFTVEDDGHGMSEAQIKSILEVDTKGYGVYNVNQRIKLYYGDDYGLSYESEPGKGTRAIIRLRHLES